MKIELLAAIICAVQVSAAYAATETRSFPGKDVNKAEISAETGAVSVSGAAAGEAVVTVTDNDPEKCSVTVGLEGGRLFLKAEKKKRFFGENCPAGFSVKLPQKSSLKIASGTGAVEVAGMKGEVKIKSGTGGLTLNGLAGGVFAEVGTGSVSGTVGSADVRIKSGTGSVKLLGLKGDARVETGKGSVELQWVSVPKSGSVKITSGMGGVTLLFPSDAKINAELRTSMGSQTNEFAQAAGGLTVSASSGMGAISLLKNK